MKLLLENRTYESDELVEQYAASFDSLFKKLSIYTRNSRLGLIQEGKHNDRNIYLSEDEVYATKIFASMMEYAYIDTYYRDNGLLKEGEELNENIFKSIYDKITGKHAEISPEEQKEISNDKEEQKELVKDVAEEIPRKFSAIVTFIANFAKKGISNIQNLLKFIEDAIEKIGNNAIGGLFKALGVISEFNPKNKVEEGKVYSYEEYLSESESFDINSDEYKKYEGKSLEELGSTLKEEAIEEESGESAKGTMNDLIVDVIARNSEKKEDTNESIEYTIENLLESAEEESRINFKNIIKYFKENGKFIQTITSLKKYKNKEERPGFGKALLGGVKKLLNYFKQLVISFVGSYLAEKALPVLLKFGAKIGMTALPVGWIVIVVKICWYTFGYVRILENRYKQIANNPAEEEHFFNVKVTLALILKTMNILGASLPGASALFTKWFTGLEPIAKLFSKISGNLDQLVFGVCKAMASSKSSLTGEAFDSFVKETWLSSAKEIGHPEMGESVYGKGAYNEIETLTEYSTDSPSKLSDEERKKLNNEVKNAGLNNDDAVKDAKGFESKIQAIADKFGITILLQPFSPKNIMASSKLKQWCKEHNMELETIEIGTGASVYPVSTNGSKLSTDDIKAFNEEFNSLSKAGEFGDKSSIRGLEGVFGRAFIGQKTIETITPVEIKTGPMFFNLIHKKYKGDEKILVGKNRKDGDEEFVSQLDYIHEVKVKDIDKYAKGIESWEALKNNIKASLDSEIKALEATKKKDDNWFKDNRINKKIENLKDLDNRKVIAIYALIKDGDEDEAKPVEYEDGLNFDVVKNDIPAIEEGDEESKNVPAKQNESALSERKNEKGNTKKVAVKPLMVFACDTLQGCDVIKNDKWRRKEPYELKGAFKSLTIAPAGRSDDNDIKDQILAILVGVLKTSAKTIVDAHAGFGIVKNSDGKFEMSEKSNIDPKAPIDDKIYGSLRMQDLLNILNTKESNESDLYARFYGANTSGKSKDDIKKEEKEYIENIIIPFIEKEDSDLHNELINNDKVGKWLFPDGKFDRDVILKDQEVMDAIASPMAAYAKNSKLTRTQAVNIALSDENKYDKEDKKRNDRIKTLASIIWAYKFDVNVEETDNDKLPPHEPDKVPSKALPPHYDTSGDTSEDDNGNMYLPVKIVPEPVQENLPAKVEKDGNNVRVYDTRLMQAMQFIKADIDLNEVTDPEETWKNTIVPVLKKIGVDLNDTKEHDFLKAFWESRIAYDVNGKDFTVKTTKDVDTDNVEKKVKNAIDKSNIEDAKIVVDDGSAENTELSKKAKKIAKKKFPKEIARVKKSDNSASGLSPRAEKFANMFKTRLEGGKTPEKHKEFLDEAKEKCVLFYKNTDKLEVNDDILYMPCFASTLQQVFNSANYREGGDEYDNKVRAKIEKAVNKSDYKDKEKLAKAIYNAYELIKKYKIDNKYKALKESELLKEYEGNKLVVDFSTYVKLLEQF